MICWLFFFLNLTGDNFQIANCLSQAICLSLQQCIVFLKSVLGKPHNSEKFELILH